ncbi:MAG: hypothetical protein KGL39_03035 [Patescibacteria group bacterium]|nr:hypothetical protein [Patescibacteria group bacterium]
MKKNTNRFVELQCKDAGAPTETVAQLQARKTKLEQDNLKYAGKDDPLSKAELRANRAEIKEIENSLELQSANTRLSEHQKAETERKEKAAVYAVEAMKASGDIPVRDEKLADDWKAKFVADEGLIPLVAGKAIALAKDVEAKKAGAQPGAAGGRVAPNAGAIQASSYDAGEGPLKDALKKYYDLQCANSKIKLGGSFQEKSELYRTKGEIALEAGAFYKTHLAKRISEWEHISQAGLGKLVGLEAADFADPNNNIGVLSGSLVLQRTLPVFAYEYPELLLLYTDFSDTPGLLNQTETTRIVLQPAVQKYNATLGADGRPLGWSTASPAKTTDVSMTLTDYIGVPIVFGNNILGATTRKVFDEQAVLAIKAIADYFINMVTKLFTPGTFNAYAAVNGVLVPIAYPTYVRALGDFALSDLDNLDAAFTSNKVPTGDRGVFLTPTYYGKLRQDMRLTIAQAASITKAGDVSPQISEAILPKLCGFMPIKAGYLPNTNFLTGFAFHKAAVVLKSRLPQDFTQALGVMIPGSATTITDPDTKISIMLVQYVNLTQNYAEWRPEVELGVSAGDTRGGICITSQ